MATRTGPIAPDRPLGGARPVAVRLRTRYRGLSERTRRDDGVVLVLVLVMSLLLVAAVSAALASSSSSLGLASRYRSSEQSGLAARSGLSAVLADMRNQGAYTTFPCSLSGSLGLSGAASSYSVSVAYSSSTSALTCAGSTLGGSTPPTSAKVVSTGTAPHASATVMEEDLSISAANTVLSQALGYAIFTSANLSMTGNNNLYQTAGQPPPNIYVGNQLTCTNGDFMAGSVTVFAPITLANNCTMQGSLAATGSVTLANSASVGGSVTSYGGLYGGTYSGGVTLSGSAPVGDNVTAYDGNITIPNGSPAIGGNAEATNVDASGTINSAYGNINVNWNGTIQGNATASELVTTPSSSLIKGTVTQNDTSLTTPATPTQISFPVTNPTVASWQTPPSGSTTGWNVVQVGNTALGQPSCSTYFQSISSGASDQFMTEIDTVTTPTVIYAPTCNVLFQNSHTFNLTSNIALQVASLTLQNQNIFQADPVKAPGQTFDLYVYASAGTSCSTSAVDVTFSNQVQFAPSVDLFIYTPGEVNLADNNAFNGQVLACGGFSGANSFKMSFVAGLGDNLPWTSSSTKPPTETVTSTFLVSG